MQAPAKPAALYIQPRLTTIDTTIRGGPSHIDDLRGLRRFSAQFVIAACFARGRFSRKHVRTSRYWLAQQVSKAEYTGINRGNGERALTNADTVAKFMENAGLVLPHELRVIYVTSC